MEKSCGCVVFNDNKVLIVKSLNGVYGFPKGHIEENETDIECAIRETFEETGINVSVDCNNSFKISYFVNENILKNVIFFIAFVNGENVIKVQEDELDDAFWIDIDEVNDILSFNNLKDLWKDIYNKYREVYNGKIDI